MALALTLLVLALAPPDYPLVPVLDAARQACGRVAPLAAFEKSLPTQGWAPHVPAEGSWLASYAAAAEEEWGAAVTVTHRTYAREVAGRPLVAYVVMLEFNFGFDKPAGRSISCEIFDAAATGPISAVEVQRWAKRKPKVSGAGTGSVLLSWSPGLTRGSDDTSITYVPAESDFAAKRPGLAYSVTATLPKGAK